MALVHDDDLLCIDSTVCSSNCWLCSPSHSQLLESLSPDIVISHLRESAPKIWQVQFGAYVTLLYGSIDIDPDGECVHTKIILLLFTVTRVLQQRSPCLERQSLNYLKWQRCPVLTQPLHRNP